MAFSDYGCLVKRDGVLLLEEETDDLTDNISPSNHGVIGSKECYISFYKYSVKLRMNDELVERIYMHDFNGRKSIRFNFDGREVHIKNVSSKYRSYSNRYLLSWQDRDGTRWKVLFGGGVGHWCRKWWNMIGVANNNAVVTF